MAWLFDTDMHIHRTSADEAVKKAAKAAFANRSPTAASSFSKVEYKNAYIQKIKLVRDKFSRSSSLRQAVVRIQNSQSRQTNLMVAALIEMVESSGVRLADWDNVRIAVLSMIDAEMANAANRVEQGVDEIRDEFACSRAAESVRHNGSHWVTDIRRCTSENTTCSIEMFFESHRAELEVLARAIDALDGSNVTPEIHRIRDVVRTTLIDGFPWQGKTCQRVGDLLIALQAKGVAGLVSSNRAEHVLLSRSMGYNLDLFPYAEIREK